MLFCIIDSFRGKTTGCSLAGIRAAAVQVSFAETVVTPVFKALASLAPAAAQRALDHIENNIQLWNALGKTDPSPLAVIPDIGMDTVKKLHVYSGEAVSPEGTRQCGSMALCGC